MRRKKKNNNNQTFDVYPHLPQYQYVTGIPKYKNGGSYFTYDDYMTDLVTANTGMETNEVTDKVPEFALGNSNLANLFKAVSSVKPSMKKIKDASSNINPKTGRPYSKLDFAKTKITNTTDENALIDGEALDNSFNIFGNIKKGKNNADNLLMSQKEAQAGYFNQMADYHSNTFLNDDGSSVASKQTMDNQGNISYADIIENKDVQSANPSYNPTLPEGPDNLKFITENKDVSRSFDVNSDMTNFDKAQANLKDYNVERIMTTPEGNVTDFTKFDENGKRIIEDYDPEKTYQSGEYNYNLQDRINENQTTGAYGGEYDLREFIDGGDPNTGFYDTTDQPVNNKCICPEGSERAGEEYLSSGSCGYSESMCGRMIDETNPLDVVEANDNLALADANAAAAVDQNNPEVPLTTESEDLTNTETEDQTNNDSVLDMDYGDGMDGKFNRFRAATNTGAIGKASGMVIEAIGSTEKPVDAFNAISLNNQTTRAEQNASNMGDEAIEVNPIIESSRGAKGDFDVNSGLYRASSLGYGDGPRGQIAKMGQEMNAPMPDYSYLKQFLDDSLVSYDPEYLMMQAKNGGDIIDADVDLIKQLMAAGADFEMI
tara:strand:+ start:6012 stop:7817 length:1806 start_codon:yes stop_codon:yes gene_type:complete